MQELHTVLHHRSVLGNLNSTLWAGLIVLEICALQLQLCNHVQFALSSFFSQINRTCMQLQVVWASLTHMWMWGDKVMHCYYCKLTGESDIGVRHAPLGLSGRFSLASREHEPWPLQVFSAFACAVCRGGRVFFREKDNLRPLSLSHYFHDCFC